MIEDHSVGEREPCILCRDSLCFLRQSNLQTGNEGYKIFETIPIGPYTLQVWSPHSKFSQKYPQKKTNKRIVQFKSYLPQGTSGIYLPQFTQTVEYIDTEEQHTTNGVLDTTHLPLSCSTPATNQTRTTNDYRLSSNRDAAHYPSHNKPSLSSTRHHPISLSTVASTDTRFHVNIYKNGSYEDPQRDPQLAQLLGKEEKKDDGRPERTMSRLDLCKLITVLGSRYNDNLCICENIE